MNETESFIVLGELSSVLQRNMHVRISHAVQPTFTTFIKKR